MRRSCEIDGHQHRLDDVISVVSRNEARRGNVLARIVECQDRAARVFEHVFDDGGVVLGLSCMRAEHDEVGFGRVAHSQHAFRGRTSSDAGFHLNPLRHSSHDGSQFVIHGDRPGR